MTALDELRAADAARLKQEQKQNTAINARARAARLAAGRCPTCGRQAARGVTCEDCRRRGSAARKKLVAGRSQAGICKTCGKVPVSRFADCLKCRLLREAKRARRTRAA